MKTKSSLPMTQTEFIRRYKQDKKLVIFLRVFILVLFFLLWEGAARLFLIDPFIFSSPVRLIQAFIDLLPGGEIFFHMGITLLETFISFFLVLALGLVTSVILWWKRSISQVIEPYLIALNSLPKSALAPILIVWLGNNMKTIIVCAIMLAVFGTIINLYTDFVNTDPDKILLVKTLGGNKKDILFKVVIPQNLPALISSMKVNIGLCLVGVIIGEFLAANAGLGYLIIYGSQVFKLDWVMMSIVILCIMATMLYGIVRFFEKKYGEK
ncbi:NitT/TauT family transport system permease protein [Catenibacillus scindens]|uniref:NitT/TauT family transport system permease protein n=1 Tax=Catenibacillus scindens TaxID=673271 RepID=A0A7W8M3W1_9FIRM|nr:ABC transporter permease [Catenibacillus scindens]MBB5262912.1 NitT/TauT family transport system permease protein [Catenibacillus scindens]